jgi:hypothetical protein
MDSVDAILKALDSADPNVRLMARSFLRARLKENPAPVAYGLEISHVIKNKPQGLILSELIVPFCNPDNFIILFQEARLTKRITHHLRFYILIQTIHAYLEQIPTREASSVVCQCLIWTTENKDDIAADLICEILLKTAQARPHPDFFSVAEVLEALVTQERRKNLPTVFGGLGRSLHVVVPYEPTLAELLLLLPESDLPLPATAPISPDDLPRPAEASSGPEINHTNLWQKIRSILKL